MKTRFVKLLGLLTVLMVPVVLWAFWPYWHPMWWTESEPPITDSWIRQNLCKGATVHRIEVVGWFEPPEPKWYGYDSVSVVYADITRHRIYDMRTHQLLTINDAAGRFSIGRSVRYRSKPNDAQIRLWMRERNKPRELQISPHAWKRVTGEVLAPSRLKELESGGVD